MQEKKTKNADFSENPGNKTNTGKKQAINKNTTETKTRRIKSDKKRDKTNTTEAKRSKSSTLKETTAPRTSVKNKDSEPTAAETRAVKRGGTSVRTRSEKTGAGNRTAMPSKTKKNIPSVTAGTFSETPETEVRRSSNKNRKVNFHQTNYSKIEEEKPASVRRAMKKAATGDIQGLSRTNRKRKKQTRHYMAAAVLVALGAGLFLTLFTQNPSNDGLIAIPDGEIINLFGKPGALAADALFELFGVSSFSFSLVCLLLGILALLGQEFEVKPKVIIGLVSFLAGSMPLCHFLFDGGLVFGYPAGGMLGEYLCGFATANMPGSLFVAVCLVLMLVGGLWVTDTGFKSFFKGLWRVLAWIWKLICIPFRRKETDSSDDSEEIDVKSSDSHKENAAIDESDEISCELLQKYSDEATCSNIVFDDPDEQVAEGDCRDVQAEEDGVYVEDEGGLKSERSVGTSTVSDEIPASIDSSEDESESLLDEYEAEKKSSVKIKDDKNTESPKEWNSVLDRILTVKPRSIARRSEETNIHLNEPEFELGEQPKMQPDSVETKAAKGGVLAGWKPNAGMRKISSSNKSAESSTTSDKEVNIKSVPRATTRKSNPICDRKTRFVLPDRKAKGGENAFGAVQDSTVMRNSTDSVQDLTLMPDAPTKVASYNELSSDVAKEKSEDELKLNLTSESLTMETELLKKLKLACKKDEVSQAQFQAIAELCENNAFGNRIAETQPLPAQNVNDNRNCLNFEELEDKKSFRIGDTDIPFNDVTYQPGDLSNSLSDSMLSESVASLENVRPFRPGKGADGGSRIISFDECSRVSALSPGIDQLDEADEAQEEIALDALESIRRAPAHAKVRKAQNAKMAESEENAAMKDFSESEENIALRNNIHNGWSEKKESSDDNKISKGKVIERRNSGTSFVVADAPKKASVAELDAAEKMRREMMEANASFQRPPLSLLKYNPASEKGFEYEALEELADKIEEKLADYKVKGNVVQICPGPVVTRFEFLPVRGTKLNTISCLSNELKMALEVVSIRILAPIPGKGVVGIEIPNEKRDTIYIKEIIGSQAFMNAKSVLTVALGKDIEGQPVVSDLAGMPHVIVAGSTGSGKSVAVNTMLCSLLYNATPDQVKLILVDPKCLELSIYNGVPHLLLPPITEPAKAVQALNWACEEMERRYRLLEDFGVRNIAGYNEKLKKATDESRRDEMDPRILHKLEAFDDDGKPLHRFMPYIVIVIDEYADLRMVVGKDVEVAVCRLAQKARAAGIHVILATQRPSVDIITGVIKNNFPTRLAFRVTDGATSKTILGETGAEELLGRGDGLYKGATASSLLRVHGAYVSDEEVQAVVDFLHAQAEPEYDESILAPKDEVCEEEQGDDQLDALYEAAINVILESGQASASLLQRKLRIGYNRAGRLIDQLEKQGVVGPAQGAKGREILIGKF